MSHHHDDNVDETQPHRNARRPPPKQQPSNSDNQDGRGALPCPRRHGEQDYSPLHDSLAGDSPEQAPRRYDQPVRGGQHHRAAWQQEPDHLDKSSGLVCPDWLACQ